MYDVMCHVHLQFRSELKLIWCNSIFVSIYRNLLQKFVRDKTFHVKYFRMIYMNECSIRVV